LSEWHDVDSSNIKRARHTGDALEVEFHTGAVYSYPEAQAHEMDALVNAPSAGSHFHANIKGRYTGTRIS
jgi:pyridoxine 5'-phosphate synthase PdxJ